MKPLAGVTFLVFVLVLSLASSQPAQAQTENTGNSRPATTTTSGTTGLWFVPTSEVLPAKKWSVSFYRTNVDDGQGFTDISTFPATFAVGLGNRAEVFGSWAVVTRLDRDSRPLFFDGLDDKGVGGGIVVDYPHQRNAWSGNKLGDFTAGVKVNLLGASTSPFGAGVRLMAKLPVGDKDGGTSTGKADFEIDGIVSSYNQIIEVAGYAGYLMRGNPDGFDLTNGIRWGVGAGLPHRYSLGFRVIGEVFGEHYFDDVITAPAGLTGVDGSIVPISTRVKSPMVASLGLTWQAPNGFFIGGAASLNISMKGRDEVGSPSTPKDDKGIQVRIGFHPGANDRRGVFPPRDSAGGPPPTAAPPTAGGPGAPGGPGGPGGPGAPAGPGAGAPAGPGAGAPAGPGAGAPPAAAPTPAPPQNRPPTVVASCNPCTVEVGRTSTVTADAQDPDGDPLTYQWTNAAGTLASPTSRQSQWTAPMQVGPVPFTVTVNDGRGGTARATTTIQVIQPTVQQFTFEDVHFEFDRFTLRQDALSVLDGAVKAMQANPALQLEIEGHTCNIGTPEYNLALGDRRARAVRDYLVSRGIAGERLRTVSYGEERPKHDNSREETRRLNRRAALVVRLQ